MPQKDRAEIDRILARKPFTSVSVAGVSDGGIVIIIVFLLLHFPDGPDDGEEEEGAEEGGEEILGADLNFFETEVDVKEVEDDAADDGAGEADAEVGEDAEAFFSGV